MAKFKYEFKEDVILEDLKKYIDSTYSKHYSQGKLQATEILFDADHGVGFCNGNIMKYAMRFGKKDGKNIDDLLKIIHYTMIAIYILRLEEKNGKKRRTSLSRNNHKL